MLTIDPAALAKNFEIFGGMFVTVSILMGLGIMIGGFFHLHRYGQTRTMMSHQVTIAKPLVMLMAGATLLALPFFAGTLLQNFWSTHTPLAYEGANAGWSQLVPAVLIFVRVIGIGSFIRGVVLLSRMGHYGGQPGQISKALVHLLGGLLAVHVLGTQHLLANILGMSG